MYFTQDSINALHRRSAPANTRDNIDAHHVIRRTVGRRDLTTSVGHGRAWGYCLVTHALVNDSVTPARHARERLRGVDQPVQIQRSIQRAPMRRVHALTFVQHNQGAMVPLNDSLPPRAMVPTRRHVWSSGHNPSSCRLNSNVLTWDTKVKGRVALVAQRLERLLNSVKLLPKSSQEDVKGYVASLCSQVPVVRGTC